MSAALETYECHACTFVQSKKRPTCEMCESPNPYFISENFDSDAAVAEALSNLPTGRGLVVCPHCDYINIGSHVQICEGCYQNLYDTLRVPRRPDLHDLSDESDDSITVEDEPVDVPAEEKERKPVAAVEKGLDDNQLVPYFNRYILLARDQQQKKHTFANEQLHGYLIELFHGLEYQNHQSSGQLTFPTCQICYEDGSMVTMKACGHRVVCAKDFSQYLALRIRDEDILPWIACPAESCSVPCHVDNIINDGCLTYSELRALLNTYMLKKLSRNENFIACIHCQKGGFLQIGPSEKQTVRCSICNKKQIIEKGADGDLDIDFKTMINTGQLRDCPTCRHWTLKEKGLCNVIECAKCGIWWNWNTKEQGHNGADLKQRARMNGTLWEPGELRYQQELERDKPEEFKALLERNGIQYNPDYVRGSGDGEDQ